MKNSDITYALSHTGINQPVAPSSSKNEVRNIPNDPCNCYGADIPDNSVATLMQDSISDGAKATKRCCRTCEDVRDAYAKKGWVIHNFDDIKPCKDEGYFDLVQYEKDHNEGCRVEGHLNLKKLPGNFHFATGKSVNMNGEHVHNIDGHDLRHLDFTHTIHELRFGDYYSHQNNPLTDVQHGISRKKLPKHHIMPALSHKFDQDVRSLMRILQMLIYTYIYIYRIYSWAKFSLLPENCTK